MNLMMTFSCMYIIDIVHSPLPSDDKLCLKKIECPSMLNFFKKENMYE